MRIIYTLEDLEKAVAGIAENSLTVLGNLCDLRDLEDQRLWITRDQYQY
jgi:hypothetical protein